MQPIYVYIYIYTHDLEYDSDSLGNLGAPLTPALRLSPLCRQQQSKTAIRAIRIRTRDTRINRLLRRPPRRQPLKRSAQTEFRDWPGWNV